MIFNITLNGTKITRDIPESWDKVTFRQCLDLIKCKEDITKIVSVLTGIDEATLKSAQIHNLSALLAAIQFLQRDMTYVMPDKIAGYVLPKDLEGESIAQYSDIQEIVKNFDAEDNLKNVEKYPLIVATYCVTPYDFKKAEIIAGELFNAPCTEVMAVGNFTLARLLASKLNIPNPFPLVGTRPSRLRRAMIAFRNRLDFTIRYFSWRRALPLPVKNYLSGR